MPDPPAAGAPAHPYTRMLLASEMSPHPGLGIPDIRIEDFEPAPAAG